MVKPTLKQKLAFKNLLEKLSQQAPFELKEIMLASGYSKNTAINPGKNLLQKEGWQQLLAKIDDESLLERLYEIAFDKKDKRASLTAIKEVLLLKDRYPDKKVRVGVYEEREAVFE